MALSNDILVHEVFKHLEPSDILSVLKASPHLISMAHSTNMLYNTTTGNITKAKITLYVSQDDPVYIEKSLRRFKRIFGMSALKTWTTRPFANTVIASITCHDIHAFLRGMRTLKNMPLVSSSVPTFFVESQISTDTVLVAFEPDAYTTTTFADMAFFVRNDCPNESIYTHVII
jgi:hypothetical protein